MRKALNFGHTIGHGIEAVKGIKGRRTVGLFHGECVALGMLPMIESKALQKRVRAVYRRLGLPLRTTYNKEKVLAEMLHDKKAQGGQITIIKVPGLGCWRAETIPVEGLRPLCWAWRNDHEEHVRVCPLPDHLRREPWPRHRRRAGRHGGGGAGG